MHDSVCFGDALRSLAQEGFLTILINDAEHDIGTFADSNRGCPSRVVLLRLTDSVNLLSANDLTDIVAVVGR